MQQEYTYATIVRYISRFTGRDSKSVVDCFSEVLTTPDVPLRRLHRCVTKKELNLL